MAMDPWGNFSPDISQLSGRLPTEDRKCLAGLTSSSDIQAWTRSRAEEYRQLALTLLSIHNIVTPIHRLPTEVLENTLERCWRNRESLRLTHVCRRWRSILLDGTAFWADAISSSELRGQVQVWRSEVPYVKTLLAHSTRNKRAIDPRFFGFPRSISKSLKPYTGSLASLHVTVGDGDLENHLWPALRSGMPNLVTLSIQIMVTEEDIEDHDIETTWFYSHTEWTTLPLLREDSLPLLTRLTCPSGLFDYFSFVPLRHLKLQWWDSEVSQIDMPFSDTSALGTQLLSHQNTLETLEIVDRELTEGFGSVGRIELPRLQGLRVRLECLHDFAPLLAFLSFPPTTRIHIINKSTEVDSFRDALPQDHPEKLDAIVGDINRLHIQQQGPEQYIMWGYAGDAERLCMDAFGLPAEDLAHVFRTRARITRLVLSAMHLSDPDIWTDGQHGHHGSNQFEAFPHVTHLDVGGRAVEFWVGKLNPSEADLVDERGKKRRERAHFDWVCPSLSELVVSFEPKLRPVTPRPRFLKQCSVLHRALAWRASRGTRLSYLELRFPPGSTLTGSGSDSDDVVDSDSEEVVDGDSKQSEDDGVEKADDGSKEMAGRDSNAESGDHGSAQGSGSADDVGSEVHTKSNSGDSMNTSSGEESGAGRSPPPPSMQSKILQSLRELVDGPVVVKVYELGENAL